MTTSTLSDKEAWEFLARQYELSSITGRKTEYTRHGICYALLVLFIDDMISCDQATRLKQYMFKLKPNKPVDVSKRDWDNGFWFPTTDFEDDSINIDGAKRRVDFIRNILIKSYEKI